MPAHREAVERAAVTARASQLKTELPCPAPVCHSALGAHWQPRQLTHYKHAAAPRCASYPPAVVCCTCVSHRPTDLMKPLQAPNWPAAAPPRPAVSQLWPGCSPRSAQPAHQQAAGGAASAGSSLGIGWLWPGGSGSSGAAPLAAPGAGAWTWPECVSQAVPPANQQAAGAAAAPAAIRPGDGLWQAPAQHAAGAPRQGHNDGVPWESGETQVPPQDPGRAGQPQVGAWNDRALSHSRAGPGPSSMRQACAGAANRNPGEGQGPAEGWGPAAHPATRGCAPGAWPEHAVQQHVRTQAALPAAELPAGSKCGAAWQGGCQNAPRHGTCWPSPSRSVEARSGVVGAGARSAKDAAAPEPSGASDGRGAAATSGGAGGGCAGWHGQAEPAGAQRPADPDTEFARAAQPPANEAGHAAAAASTGRARAREAAGLALQALQQRAREFAEHVFARGPPPATHPCPGVYKAGGHGCGAPLRFAPICLARGKVVERWRCARAGDGCGYAEFPAPRLRWPQLALEAVSPDAFQVQVAPGAEEAVASCGGLRTLLAVIGVPASLELPGGAPAGNPNPDPVISTGSLGEGGGPASAAVQVGGAQHLQGPGMPQGAAGMPCGKGVCLPQPPELDAGLKAAGCADAAGGPCWRGAQPSQPRAAPGGDGVQGDPSASCHADPDVASSREATERMPGSGGAAGLCEVPTAAGAEPASSTAAAHGSDVDCSGAGQPAMLAPVNPSSSGTSRPAAAEQPVLAALNPLRSGAPRPAAAQQPVLAAVNPSSSGAPRPAAAEEPVLAAVDPGSSGTPRPAAAEEPVLAPVNPSSSETPPPPAAEQPVRMAWPHYAGVVAVLRGRRHGLRNLLGPAGLVPEGTLAALRCDPVRYHGLSAVSVCAQGHAGGCWCNPVRSCYSLRASTVGPTLPGHLACKIWVLSCAGEPASARRRGKWSGATARCRGTWRPHCCPSSARACATGWRGAGACCWLTRWASARPCRPSRCWRATRRAPPPACSSASA